MSKKRVALTVSEDLSDIFTSESIPVKVPADGLPIVTTLKTVLRQMEVSGMRPRAIGDYDLHVNHFAKITGAQVLEELAVEHIYKWLASMDVSNQTKLNRLKCLKAFLSRCFYNGWIIALTFGATSI